MSAAGGALPLELERFETNAYGNKRAAPEIVACALDECANAAYAHAAALRFVLQDESENGGTERGGRIVSAAARALEDMAENLETAGGYLWEWHVTRQAETES